MLRKAICATSVLLMALTCSACTITEEVIVASPGIIFVVLGIFRVIFPYGLNKLLGRRVNRGRPITPLSTAFIRIGGVIIIALGIGLIVVLLK